MTHSPLAPWRRTLTKVLVPLYLTLIFGAPAIAVTGLWFLVDHSWLRLVVALSAPLVYSFLFCVTAGLLCLPHRKGIIAGKFPRDVGHPVYFDRRMYGLCWTSLFYFKPVYYLALTIPTLKWITFRLFGYRGQMDFTTYPDTWIRDLPLLDLGKGAYIANRATLGTNLALPTGEIMVAPISVGHNGLVGHLVAIACGSSLGAGSEIGACGAVGYKSTIGANTQIAGRCVVEHGVVIGDDCSVGTNSYIGSASRVASGAIIRPGSNLPPRSKVLGPHGGKRQLPHLDMEADPV